MNGTKNNNSGSRRVSFIPVTSTDGEDESAFMNIEDGDRINLIKIPSRQIQQQKSSTSTRSVVDRSTQIAAMYSAVIKLSNENKINQKNTWNLDLINHMEDVLLDGSFKASTTLDASVKIYGCRVDDTLNTGYRILDNLNRGELPKVHTEAPKQSKKLGVVNTLESNLSNIEIDMSDLIFNADPMFHLMSRKFDEGGAKGLLMTNLGLTEGCVMVFNSNDIIEIPEENTQVNDIFEKEFHDYYGITELMEPACHSHSISSIITQPICPDLQPLFQEIRSFDRNADDIADVREDVMDENSQDISHLDDYNIDLNPEIAPIPVNTISVAEPAYNDFDVGDDAMMDGYDDQLDNVPPSNTVVVTDKDRNIMNSKETVYSYFSPSGLISSWAGPSHWKINKKPKAKKGVSTTEKVPKIGKKVIDFSGENPIKSSFAFPEMKRISDLCISEAQFESQGDHIMPEDCHFSIDSLQRLFCRSDISLHRVVMFKKASAACTPDEWEISADNVDVGGCSLENPMDLVPLSYEALYGDATDGEMPEMDVNVEEGEVSHAGFISEIEDSVVVPEDGGCCSTLLQADRIVQQIEVNFSNTASQVDIQLLKKLIWRVLEESVINGESVLFSDLVSRLRKEGKDVAIQFYFICLLHISCYILCFVLPLCSDC